MGKSKIFIGISISFAAGIFLAAVSPVSMPWIFFVFAVAAAALGLSLYAKKPMLALAAAYVLCAGAGAWRMDISRVPNEFASLLGTKQEMEGYVVEDVDIRQNMQLLTVQPKGHGQRILVIVPLANPYFYGDWVVLSGKITAPQNFADFDYVSYLERFDIYALMRYPRAIILKNHRQNKIKEELLRVKRFFVQRIDAVYDEPERSLLLGILIGARKTLPQNIVDNFNATGTSHIIAISGYNITIIIAALGFLAKYLGRRASFWISVSVIAAFVVFAGASASVVRAAVMGALLLTSLNIGRQYRVASALFFAGFIMLTLNPKILMFDAGFQLSFLATLGIVYFAPLAEQLTERWENPLQVKSTLIATFAAIVATAPLLAFQFGTLSLVAPLVNILVLPLIPLIMLLGFLSVLPWLGVGIAFAAHFFLAYILGVIGWFAGLHYSSLQVEMPGWFFALLYACVFLLWYVLRHYAGKLQPVEQNVRL